MTTEYVVREEGLTVDLICCRHYGRTAGVTEAVFAANPSLAHCNLFLPLGLTLTLPPKPSGSAIKPIIRLYD